MTSTATIIANLQAEISALRAKRTGTDDLFSIIKDAHIVLRSRGVFYQKKLYRRGNRLYAGWGGGFIRIGAGDATSNPNVSWESMDAEFPKDSSGNPVPEAL